MPIPGRHNYADNPGFRLWDYGTTFDLAALPANGYVANRWKVVNTGYTGTVSKGTTPTTTSIPKWLRGVDCIDINITGVGSKLALRQVIEDAQTYARSTAFVSVVVMGPTGALFYVGAHGLYNRQAIHTPDVPINFDVPIGLPDLPTPTMDFEPFESPDLVGLYKVAYVQLRMGVENASNPDGYELPTLAESRRRCARYTAPLLGSFEVVATDTTRVVGVRTFREPMRVAPTLVQPAASASLVTLGGAVVLNAAPTISVLNASVNGARIVIEGYTGLTVDARYMVTAASLGTLHADY